MSQSQPAVERFYCGSCRAVFRTAFSRCPLDGEPLDICHTDPLAGCDFADRYVIEECIGEGAMGRVYRARHARVSRRFAVKVLFGDHAADSKMRSRFAREAEAASRLNHTNVISVIDFGETDEQLLYLVMDFVEGPSLTDVIEAEAPFPRERVVHIIRGLCKGLAHAHKKGLIHRDFKGENVILARDSDGADVPKIVDFGIAMMLERKSHKLTTEGMVLGTPAVMSPEQAAGDQVDHRTDLFSLGVVMYEMLSGVLPFEGTPMQIARQNLMDRAPRVAERVPGLMVDPAVEDLAHWLMAKKAADRPQDAKAVVDYLDELEGINPSRASMVTPLPVAREMTPAPMPAAGNAGTWEGAYTPAPQAVPREQSQDYSQPGHAPPGYGYSGQLPNDSLGAAPTVAQLAQSESRGKRFAISAAVAALVLAAVGTAVVLSGSGGDEGATEEVASATTDREQGGEEAGQPGGSSNAGESESAESGDKPSAGQGEPAPAAEGETDGAAVEPRPSDSAAEPAGAAAAGAATASGSKDEPAVDDSGSTDTSAGARSGSKAVEDGDKRERDKKRDRARKKDRDRKKVRGPPPNKPKVAPSRGEVTALYRQVAGQANKLPRGAPNREALQNAVLGLTPTPSRLASPEARTRLAKKLRSLARRIRRAKAAAK